MNLVILAMFNAPTAQATFEIIVIILLALILGVILGWWIFSRKSSHSDEHIKEFEAFRKKLIKEQKEQDDLILSVKNSCSGKVDLSGLENSIADLKSKQLGFANASSSSKDYDNEVQSLEAEDKKLWDAINALKVVDKKEVVAPAGNDKELNKLQDVAAKKHLINFSSIGTATESDKDDLKLIKGVGPFIEKKLNALDIWTFKQVGSFTDTDVENVTEAIEFFPGRITRDNWASQAKELANS